MYEKLRNFRTIHPGAVSLVLKYAQNLKKNCHEISRREHCAFQRYCAKSRGGAKLAPPPPPGLIRVKPVYCRYTNVNNTLSCIAVLVQEIMFVIGLCMKNKKEENNEDVENEDCMFLHAYQQKL